MKGLLLICFCVFLYSCTNSQRECVCTIGPTTATRTVICEDQVTGFGATRRVISCCAMRGCKTK